MMQSRIPATEVPATISASLTGRSLDVQIPPAKPRCETQLTLRVIVDMDLDLDLDIDPKNSVLQ